MRRRLPVRTGKDQGGGRSRRIDRRALARVYEQAKCDDLAVFFFTTDRTGAGGDETVYSRMLAPQFGVSEDPATGGASGPLGRICSTTEWSAPRRRARWSACRAWR